MFQLGISVFVYTYICASTNRLNFLYIPSFQCRSQTNGFLFRKMHFTVVETLPGRKFFLCEEGTIGLVELLAFVTNEITKKNI